MELTVNQFSKGLQLDTNPMVLGNDTLSDALNATFVTMNDNEVILQNDMGNRRVDNAFLPPGYEPVGIKEYGGVIYVASYNPITNKSQIGSFPSPERKISEIDDSSLGCDFNFELEKDNTFNGNILCVDNNNNVLSCWLKSDVKLFPLSNDLSLHTGDKFVVFTNNHHDKLKTLTNYDNVDDNKVKSPKNKDFTLSLGILNSLNEFVDITKNLCRWKCNTTIIEQIETVSSNPELIEDFINDSDIYKFNKGYFIAEVPSENSSNIWNTTNDLNLITERLTKPANTYSYKLIGPLYAKLLYNHITNFSYNIYGTRINDKADLTIEGFITYNCPDGVPSIGNGNEIYSTFEEGEPNSTFEGFTLFKHLNNTNYYIKESPEQEIEIIRENCVYNPITNLYTVKIIKTYKNISATNGSIYNYLIAVGNKWDELDVYIKGLSTLGSVDFNMFGTGQIEITGYRFINDIKNYSSTITYTLLAYPKYGDKFSNLCFTLVNSTNPSDTYKIENLDVNNGRSILNIDWNVPDSDGHILKPRTLYGVEIKYNNKEGTLKFLSKGEFTYNNKTYNFIFTGLVGYTNNNLTELHLVLLLEPFPNNRDLESNLYWITITGLPRIFRNSEDSPGLELASDSIDNNNLFTIEVFSLYYWFLTTELFNDCYSYSSDNFVENYVYPKQSDGTKYYIKEIKNDGTIWTGECEIIYNKLEIKLFIDDEVKVTVKHENSGIEGHVVDKVINSTDLKNLPYKILDNNIESFTYSNNLNIINSAGNSIFDTGYQIITTGSLIKYLAFPREYNIRVFYYVEHDSFNEETPIEINKVNTITYTDNSKHIYFYNVYTFTPLQNISDYYITLSFNNYFELKSENTYDIIKDINPKVDIVDKDLYPNYIKFYNDRDKKPGKISVEFSRLPEGYIRDIILTNVEGNDQNITGNIIKNNMNIPNLLLGNMSSNGINMISGRNNTLYTITEYYKTEKLLYDENNPIKVKYLFKSFEDIINSNDPYTAITEPYFAIVGHNHRDEGGENPRIEGMLYRYNTGDNTVFIKKVHRCSKKTVLNYCVDYIYYSKYDSTNAIECSFASTGATSGENNWKDWKIEDDKNLLQQEFIKWHNNEELFIVGVTPSTLEGRECGTRHRLSSNIYKQGTEWLEFMDRNGQFSGNERPANILRVWAKGKNGIYGLLLTKEYSYQETDNNYWTNDPENPLLDIDLTKNLVKEEIISRLRELGLKNIHYLYEDNSNKSLYYKSKNNYGYNIPFDINITIDYTYNVINNDPNYPYNPNLGTSLNTILNFYYKSVNTKNGSVTLNIKSNDKFTDYINLVISLPYEEINVYDESLCTMVDSNGELLVPGIIYKSNGKDLIKCNNYSITFNPNINRHDILLPLIQGTPEINKNQVCWCTSKYGDYPDNDNEGWVAVNTIFSNIPIIDKFNG